MTTNKQSPERKTLPARKLSRRQLEQVSTSVAEKAIAEMMERAAAREASYDYAKITGMLRDLRIKARISLPDLAEKTGLPAAYLYKVECAANSEVKLSTLVIILDAMNYDLEIKPRRVASKKAE